MSRKGAKNFTYKQRIQLSEYLQLNMNKTDIAKELGFCLATIYNEIQRGTVNGIYSPDYAQNISNEAVRNKGRNEKLLVDKKLAEIISNYILNDHLSLGKIIEKLQGEGKNCPSKTTLYASIDKGLIPNVTRESLNNKTTSIYSNGLIRLPNWVRNKMDIKDGDLLLITFDGNKMLLEKFNYQAVFSYNLD